MRETDTSLCGQTLRGPAWARGPQQVLGLVSGRLPGGGTPGRKGNSRQKGCLCRDPGAGGRLVPPRDGEGPGADRVEWLGPRPHLENRMPGLFVWTQAEP